MGKRSPRDTTPPEFIVDWDREAALAAEHAFMDPPILEDEAEDEYFDHAYFEGDAPPRDLLNWWRKPPKRPGLPHEFGLPRLARDVRESTLRTEGFYFRKKYNENGEVYRAGTPEKFDDIHEEPVPFNIHSHEWLDSISVFPESDRSYNIGLSLPGALTAEGLRLMDNLYTEPPIEEMEDIPIGGAVFWLMKRAKEARLKRLREKRLREKEQAA